MAEKLNIPEEVKAELPPTKWGKILGVTPIVMTVIATMLAGLSSSEMTRAQYDRSLAAQLQAKAGDQWSYYQAKKLRGAVARNTLDLLAATAEIQPFTMSILARPETMTIVRSVDSASLDALMKNELPAAKPAKFEELVNLALDAVESSKPEPEIAAMLTKITPTALGEALNAARDAALTFDNAAKPINKTSDQLDEALMAGDKSVFRSFSAARLRFAAARYETEARLNLAIAGIYELQVRQNNYSAEKHHARSGKFFFGMLASQMAVILSTFAIAARKRNFLWSVAAAAGTAAVAFSVYVYLYV